MIEDTNTDSVQGDDDDENKDDVIPTFNFQDEAGTLNTLSIGMGKNVSITFQSSEESIEALVTQALRVVNSKAYQDITKSISANCKPTGYASDGSAGYE